MQIKLSDIDSFEYVKCKEVYDLTIEENHNYFIYPGKPILVHNSGKTWSILQYLIVYLMQNNNKVVTIGRDHLTTLRKTLYIDFLQILEMFDFSRTFEINKTEMLCKFNKNILRFVGLNDDIMLTHGLVQDVFWINEAINVSRDTFDQLEQRTAGFWIVDYNPITTIHWLYDLEKREDVRFHQTTVLNNPFAPLEVLRKIMSYEPTEQNKLLGTADAYKWKVYGQGVRATDDATVFKEWQYYDEDPKNYDLKVYGLDFGFSNSKTAVVQCIIDGNNLYLKEIIYETGLINSDIKDKLNGKVINNYIVADSAEPKSINELRRLNLPVIPARKGPDSIRYGINKLLTLRIFLDKNSLNLQNEFINYRYNKTKEGKILNDPVKESDDLIDAARYAVTKFS